MKHENLIELGFKLYGVEENDPFYKITFRSPFKFGISHLSGVLDEGRFLLYGNYIRYTDKNELKKVIDIVGSDVYNVA